MADTENENVTDGATEQTTPPETPPADNTTPPETAGGNETQAPSDDKDTGGLVYPSAEDADAVLAFRKSCGYPDDASGYGLPMDTDEQKSLINFIHKCQLDPIAAKTIVQNVVEVMAADEAQAKQAFTDGYNKVVDGWGESKKENESLMNKGLSLMKLDQDKLRGISEAIGVEAALSMMILLGKTQTDYSGVSGGNSEDSESLLGYIARKRG
uniref:Uncharacterized protein n=1 Tax=virus sp. ctd0M1 TaxID=2827993 RepID=A0A8S5REE5_9VIRU|nr:MAG TPA: hypothetical protein [virus sp. ctd0M1]